MQRPKRRNFVKKTSNDKSDKSLKYITSVFKTDTKPHLLRQLRLSDSRTPLNFDEFIPRMCLEWGILTPVSVIRICQEDYMKIDHRKSSNMKKSARIQSDFSVEEENSKNLHYDSKKQSPINEISSSKFDDKSGIVIKAYYDTRDKLVNLSIKGCPVRIPQKLIRALGLCMPFHSALTQLTIQKGGLTYRTIHEISRLLSHSNLTNICLDDSYIPEGNYYLLLQEITQLSYLSLNRCKISDEVCEDLARQLMFGQPAANSLQILEMASNLISNNGAKVLETMLRTNRCLLHLNLAGNYINDEGALAIFSSMMQFRISDDEIKERKAIRFGYLRNKKAAYDKCLNELLRQQSREVTTKSNSTTLKRNIRNKSSKRSQIFSRKASTRSIPNKKSQNALALSDLKGFAESFAKGLIGECTDPFPLAERTVLNESCHYAAGNLVLSSLNLAYNKLNYPSVKKLENVVRYQHAIEKTAPATGLMRVILVGNNIPEKCDELDQIEFYLNLNHSEKFLNPFSKYSFTLTPKVKKSTILKTQ